MTTYVRLIDANTVQQLPQTWRWPDGTTTSNFHLSDAATLAQAGFLPYVDGVKPTPTSTQLVGAPTYTSDGSQITSSYPLVAKPTTQINQEALTTFFSNALPTLRSLRTQAGNLSTITLSSTYSQASLQTTMRQIGSGLVTLCSGLISASHVLAGDYSSTT